MKIIWTEPAVSDLEAIHTFIARDSTAYANAFISEIIGAVQRLEKFPLAGRVVPEINNEDIRELIVGNYRVVYNVTRSTIGILTILHGAKNFQNPP